MLALAGCGGSGHHRVFVVGAVEDAAKWSPDPDRQMRLAKESGFQAVALSAVWSSGASAEQALPPLRQAVQAAVAEGVEPVLAVYQISSSTPNDAASRSAFASFAAALARALPDVHRVIVGNEPNLNRFWLPQFGPQGTDVAAWSFERLLAQTYDALKDVDSDLQVIGGGLAPHGGDRPGGSRPTHSPTRFLLDLGRAYRASGRDRPLMDALSVHVYGESPRIPPTLAHPKTTSIGIADYDELVSLLGRAFDGTGQEGPKLPIVYGEYGVETAIPPAKQDLYTGREVVDAVSEQTQAQYYSTAIRLAACQPTVEMLLLFHVSDESRLDGLQSGVRYADGSPKQSLPAVRRAIARGCPRSS
ncbi:MAG TPA: hypothetical protein VF186_02415 [Gaiellaceae bacterium]